MNSHRERFHTYSLLKIVRRGEGGGANVFKLPYFQKEAYLAQSPQFYKQMMVAGGLESCF
ncbi:amino acid--tRNA ligase-related protein [Bacillus pacificus]